MELTKNVENGVVDIHELIDEAMQRKDRTVMIHMCEFGTTVTIQPMSEDAKWTIIYALSGRRNHFVCSECGQVSDRPSTYCPNCGTQLTGVKENRGEVIDEK